MNTKVNIMISILSMMVIVTGCSKKVSSSKNANFSIRTGQHCDSLKVEIVITFNNSFSGAISPDEGYIALVSKQHAQILKLFDLSTVYISKVQFPEENYHCRETKWSKNGNYALFGCYQPNKNNVITLVWDKRTNRDVTFPDLINSIVDNSNNYIIGWNVKHRSIQIIDLVSQKTKYISDKLSGYFPWAQNFNQYNNDTILYTVDIYNTTLNKHYKYDHTEIRSMDFRNSIFKIIYSTPERIDEFTICPDNQKAMIFKFPVEIPNMLGLLLGKSWFLKSGFLNLSNLSTEHYGLKLKFHSCSQDNDHILSTVVIIDTGLVYGIYSIEQGKIFLLKDNFGHLINSNGEGSFSKNYILLQTQSNKIYLVQFKTS